MFSAPHFRCLKAMEVGSQHVSRAGWHWAYLADGGRSCQERLIQLCIFFPHPAASADVPTSRLNSELDGLKTERTTTASAVRNSTRISLHT
jgi:hypothetical protein